MLTACWPPNTFGGEEELNIVWKVLKERKRRRGNLAHERNLFCTSTATWEFRGWGATEIAKLMYCGVQDKQPK